MRKFIHLLALALCASTAVPTAGLAQGASSTHPATQFDVISIKPHQQGDNNGSTFWSSTGLEAKNVSLKNLLANAFNVKTWLVFSLPPWAESARWDIQAKATDPEATPMEKLTVEQRHALLASLLRERFGLAAHFENKVQPVYEMEVLPEGLKITRSRPSPPESEVPKFGRGSIMIDDGSMKSVNVSMNFFAESLAGQVERSILDKTGVSGEYDFELKWTPEDRVRAGDNGTATDGFPLIFTAMKEQLGLKLTPSKAPVPVVVVDSIVQPEAN